MKDYTELSGKGELAINLLAIFMLVLLAAFISYVVFDVYTTDLQIAQIRASIR